MSDLIDRQLAIDALLHNQEVYSNNFGTDAIDKYTTAIIANDVETIAQLPSAEPMWIPVEEKLPETRDWVLGIFQECDAGWINEVPFVCDYVGHETPITTSDFWILHSIDEPDSYYQGLKCVAWMPLPKPYERSEDE